MAFAILILADEPQLDWHVQNLIEAVRIASPESEQPPSGPPTSLSSKFLTPTIRGRCLRCHGSPWVRVVHQLVGPNDVAIVIRKVEYPCINGQLGKFQASTSSPYRHPSSLQPTDVVDRCALTTELHILVSTHVTIHGSQYIHSQRGEATPIEWIGYRL